MNGWYSFIFMISPWGGFYLLILQLQGEVRNRVFCNESFTSWFCRRWSTHCKIPCFWLHLLAALLLMFIVMVGKNQLVFSKLDSSLLEIYAIHQSRAWLLDHFNPPASLSLKQSQNCMIYKSANWLFHYISPYISLKCLGIILQHRNFWTKSTYIRQIFNVYETRLWESGKKAELRPMIRSANGLNEWWNRYVGLKSGSYYSS